MAASVVAYLLPSQSSCLACRRCWGLNHANIFKNSFDVLATLGAPKPGAVLRRVAAKHKYVGVLRRIAHDELG
jgi:hypothetical protein